MTETWFKQQDLQSDLEPLRLDRDPAVTGKSLGCRSKGYWGNSTQATEYPPDAPSFVIGDFNLCKPSKSLSNFQQYVTCPTRNMKCLDLCYGSIKGAYKSSGERLLACPITMLFIWLRPTNLS